MLEGAELLGLTASPIGDLLWEDETTSAEATGTFKDFAAGVDATRSGLL